MNVVAIAVLIISGKLMHSCYKVLFEKVIVTQLGN
jgi:hypothetical protein